MSVNKFEINSKQGEWEDKSDGIVKITRDSWAELTVLLFAK